MTDKKVKEETTEEKKKRIRCEISKRAREKRILNNIELRKSIDIEKDTLKCAGLCGLVKPLKDFAEDKGGLHGGFATVCKEDVALAKLKKAEKYKDIDPKKVKKKCKGKCGKTKFLTKFDKSKDGKFCHNDTCKKCRVDERQEHLNIEKQTKGEKYCTFHETYHDVSEFSDDKHATKTGLQSVCKAVQKIISQEYYSKLPEHIGKIINDCIQRCKKKEKINRGISCEIDSVFITKMYEMQSARCALTNIDLTYNGKNDRTPDDCHIMNPFNMSIDRIDSSKSYTKDNVRLVGAIINVIKWTLDDDVLRKMCLNIIHYVQYLKFFENIQQNKFVISQKNDLKYFSMKRLDNTKSNAIKRNLDVKITESDIVRQFEKQKGLCALSGTKLTFNYKNKNKLTYISIDRIDSKKGYTLDNIQLVCGIINKMKSDLSNDKFVSYCKSIYYGMLTNEVKKVKALKY
jgi:hypothetical protein